MRRNCNRDRLSGCVFELAQATAGFPQTLVLQALYVRERSGRGRFIEVSLFHTMADWMNVPYLQTRYGGKAPPRVGLRHPSIVSYGAFTCSDGKQILLSVQNDREWRVFCEKVLGDGSLADDARYARNVDRVVDMADIEARIATVMATLDREAAIALLTRAGIACGRLSTMDDMLTHPQAQHVTVDTPTGPVEMMARGTRVADGRQHYGAVPALGEQSERLRQEFGSGAGKRSASSS